jgi:microcystin degradation protein MlrC
MAALAGAETIIDIAKWSRCAGPLHLPETGDNPGCGGIGSSMTGVALLKSRESA